ncbi:MAG: hypothetical protein OEY49_15200, partial [Candidatus Heimdallarchaeota archaeon]|nr:hypothetical protein [Candidatus Heimdallarchaeota archaeon]
GIYTYEIIVYDAVYNQEHDFIDITVIAISNTDDNEDGATFLNISNNYMIFGIASMVIIMRKKSLKLSK